jgi:hypothetical protein
MSTNLVANEGQIGKKDIFSVKFFDVIRASLWLANFDGFVKNLNFDFCSL